MPYVPIEWLAEHVDVPAGTSAAQLAADLVKVGLEPEEILPAAVTGDLVVGRVLTLERLNHKGKTISYARVDVGEFNDAPGTGAEAADFPSRGVICGAPNLDEGQHVLVALPGTVLPGDFAISARKTYGHVSDGMICSELELGLGDDHTGIIVLEDFLGEGNIPPIGTNMLDALGLGTELLEINVTPDRGYCYSMRGVAREYGHSTGGTFTDPISRITPAPVTGEPGFPVSVYDDSPIRGNIGADRLVLRTVRGVNPEAPSPEWMKRRLTEAGMRPISLAVDITNYVMLDLGQPLHAYDLGLMRAPMVVRRARPGERLTTLDAVDRVLDPEDLLITDDGGERVLGLAGVMGGASTEINPDTTDVLVEAFHFDPASIARTARRHRLPSEAAKRFERGVDPQLAPYAAQRVVDLLVEYGGGVADGAVSDVDTTTPPTPVVMDGLLPARHVGVDYTVEEVVGILEQIGCSVARNGDQLAVTPPTWRPDLTQGVDLVEEVARLHGYDEIPSVVPTAAAGRGLTADQHRRRAVMRALAEHGLNEVLSYPFVGDIYRRLGLPADDPRRTMIRLENPIADDQPFMRSSILASLVDTARRNVGRGNALAVVEAGMVTRASELGPSPLPAVGVLPSDDDLAAVRAAVPDQPWHVAAIAAGPLAVGGALGAARAVDWADAIELARLVGRTVGVEIAPHAASIGPWHPGRCAELRIGDQVVGHAGELHPRVLEDLDLPERTIAFEMSLDAVFAAASDEQHEVDPVSTFPAAKEDIALVMAADIPAARALGVVREAAGELAEEVRLFDDYRSDSLGADLKSLAFALRLRAPDRTLSAEEIAGVRGAVIAAAEKELGARLR